MRRIWTFVQCGVYGKPEGFYDERYTRAVTSRIWDLGGVAEFVGDKDMPESLRYRGSWGMLSLYNPELDIGNPDGLIYATGLDTVFLRDLDRIAEGLDATRADIAGCRCPSDGQFNTMVLRIKRRSRGALAVWEAAAERDFFKGRKKPCVEHKMIRRFAGNFTGIMENGIVQSYKSQIGRFPRNHTGEQDVNKLSALVYHGEPNPHDVCDDPKWPLHDIVMENWGRYAEYGGHGCKARLAE